MQNNIVHLYTPMTDRSTSFPNRVRELRHAKGLTLEQLAEAAGMSFTMLGLLERGKRDMLFARQKAIAEALGVSPGDLLLDKDHSFPTTADERKLLENYRMLGPVERRAVRNVAENMSTYRGEDDEAAARQEEEARPKRKRA